MISIIVYGPDFACSENLTKVLSKWGKVQLICVNHSDWRNYDEGLVYNEDTRDEIHSILDSSHVLFLGGATSIHCLAKIAPSVNWLNWAKSKTVMAYFGDSAYFKSPRFYDGICTALGVNTLFLLPNLMPLSGINAVPLHHPMPVKWVDKDENLTIVHAPGRDGKAMQKGTETIEIAITELKDEYNFEYKRLMYLTIEECLNVKNSAHIVIDQIPPDGVPYGLGRTGTEGLATGSAVFTRMYDTSVLQGYFEPPPVVDVQNEKDLILELGNLLGDTNKLTSLQNHSLAWAQEHIAFEPWLKYVEKYI